MLKQWTGKASANVVYDRRVKPFTDQGLFDKVKGIEGIAIVAQQRQTVMCSAGSTPLL